MLQGQFLDRVPHFHVLLLRLLLRFDTLTSAFQPSVGRLLQRSDPLQEPLDGCRRAVNAGHLSEAISSQLGGRLEKLFGITKLRVDPGIAGVGSTGSEQSAAARVTVEQQVTRNLTITYVSNVSSTQQQVIQVEYNVNRNISIVALRDQNGTFGIDFKIKKRFP